MKKIVSELTAVRALLPAILVVLLVITAVNAYKQPTYSDVGNAGQKAKTPAAIAKAKKTKKLTGKKKVVTARKTTMPAVPAAAGRVTKVKEDRLYKDGTYKGSARGFGGPISVSVKVKKGKISKVSVLSAAAETPSYWARAKVVANAISRKKTTNVDVVSGATYSSNGIINAVRNALKKAETKFAKSKKGKKKKALEKKKAGNVVNKPNKATGPQNPNTPEEKPQTPTPPPDTGEQVYEYTRGGIAVQSDDTTLWQSYRLSNVNFRVQSNRIISVTGITWDNSESNNIPYQRRAANGMPAKIVAATDYNNIDVVSGATCCSKALIQAAQDVMREHAEKASATTAAAGSGK